MIINNPTEKDSGTYACNAQNSNSKDKITHNVQFTGESQFILEKTHGFFHRDPNKPQFQNTLGDHLVPSGGTIALQAEIIHGSVEVQWLCDKKPLTPNAKVKTINDHGVYTLIILDAADENSGTYTCRASNAFGKIESNAHVHVVSPTGNGGRCPFFVTRPPPKMKIMTGDPFSISFKLVGDPDPKGNNNFKYLWTSTICLLYLLNSCIAFSCSDFL